MTEKTPAVPTAQENWANADHWTRERLLQSIGYSSSYAKIGWKKLPYLIKDNLNRIAAKR